MPTGKSANNSLKASSPPRTIGGHEIQTKLPVWPQLTPMMVLNENEHKCARLISKFNQQLEEK